MPRGVRLYDPATLARLCRARDYLAGRFDRRTPIEDVARQADLSPFYFARLFTDAFGETPHEFVTRIRIERAKARLLADNEPITEICFDVGYESLGSFSTRFHSLVGVSPAAFRREARRLFGVVGRQWPRYYIPHCYQQYLFGGGGRVPEPASQESRSAAAAESLSCANAHRATQEAPP
jgi:AraC-like DNA-binding protein